MAERAERRYSKIPEKLKVNYIFYILLFMGLVTVISAYTCYTTLYHFFLQKLQNIYPQTQLIGMLNRVNFIIIIRIVLLMPLVIIIGLLISHRISGPLVKINSCFKEMALGDFSFFIYLRKRDELKLLASNVNGVIEEVRHLIGMERGFLKHLETEINHLKETVPLTEDSLQTVERIDSLLNQMKGHLNKYKIGRNKESVNSVGSNQ